MTRKEQIKEAARNETGKYPNACITYHAFVMGADWADEHPQDRWISVEDEMPKNKELVLITDGQFTDMGFYDYTDDAWQPYERCVGDITHWMPLPQPAKKGD